MKILLNFKSFEYSVILTAILIAFKLDGSLTSDWIWIISPMWIMEGGYLLVIMVLCILKLFIRGLKG